MIRSLTILTRSSTLPLTLAQAKDHLRVDHDADDSAIAGYLESAVDMIERRAGRTLRGLTGILHLNQFPSGADPIHVPRPPLVSVTSITYTNPSGSSVTLSSGLYEVITSAVPGEVIPVNGQSWPTALDRRGSVRVTFAAGNAADVPASLLDAIRLYLDLDYHDNDATKSQRIRDRIDSLIAGHVLRDRNLIGIST
jgi:uncharacterized phiE125 gp8 family phage protein